jgi:hypothetical protein
VRQLTWLVAAITVVACAAAKPATAPRPVKVPPPPPVVTLAVAPPAKQFLDSLADDSRTNYVETAGCITGYAVVGDTLVLGRLEGASYDHADSVNIWSFTPLCPPGVPTIHSHILPRVWAPASRTDSLTSARVGTWAIILVVQDSGWRIIVY